MSTLLPALPIEAETIAELRELYRAAEARAARLRLLSGVGRELALAHAGTVEDALQRGARSLAFFLGKSSATLRQSPGEGSIAIPAPGGSAEPIAWLVIEGCASIEAIADPEDRETTRMCLELFGATIDRIAREEERAALLSALTEREQRLEMLVSRVFSAQEEERRRVSRELHDGVAQTATALARMLEGSGSRAAQELPADERIKLAEIARELLTELRGVIGGLRPTLLDDLGLAAALHALADGLQADGYAVSVRITPAPARLPQHIETALFRVAQEAVANIRKHAGEGCPVSIELDLAAPDKRYLRIRDGGRGAGSGMSPAAPGMGGNHVGIEVMHERMAAIGGTLDWVAGDRGGVSVTATLPGLPLS